jgi:hypothetical protein
VFYELDATDPTAVHRRLGTFVDLLIATAAARTSPPGCPTYAQISQRLVKQTRDHSGDHYGVTVESVAQRPGWSEIAAVKTADLPSTTTWSAARAAPGRGLRALAS